MAKEDGGPAFPAIRGIPDIEIGGMSLRDYFAGQALQTLIAQGPDETTLGKRAYEIADAMIKARK